MPSGPSGSVPPMGILSSPWPWWIAGPLIGLTVPALLLLGNKAFGVSSNLRHVCAMLPTRLAYFRYDWRRVGGWNLAFSLGIVVGGVVGGVLLRNPEPLRVAEATTTELARLGVTVDGGFAPEAWFSSSALTSPRAWLLLLVGGFLIGFGARYAGGCTSGHAITGLANAQRPSLLAVAGFFAGGLLATHLLLPWFLGAGGA